MLEWWLFRSLRGDEAKGLKFAPDVAQKFEFLLPFCWQVEINFGDTFSPAVSSARASITRKIRRNMTPVVVSTKYKLD